MKQQGKDLRKIIDLCQTFLEFDTDGLNMNLTQPQQETVNFYVQ